MKCDIVKISFRYTTTQLYQYIWALSPDRFEPCKIHAVIKTQHIERMAMVPNGFYCSFFIHQPFNSTSFNKHSNELSTSSNSFEGSISLSPLSNISENQWCYSVKIYRKVIRLVKRQSFKNGCKNCFHPWLYSKISFNIPKNQILF